MFNKITSFPPNIEYKKLLPKFGGPFKIVEVSPNDRYRVKEDIQSTRSSRPCEGIVGLEHINSSLFGVN